MRFAKIVFWCAGVWGVLVLTPLYFLADRIGREYPPAITHLDFYFGFIGVAFAWQIAFMVIATDPVRFRPMMIPSVLEKFSYVGTLVVLHLQGRLSASQLPFGAADLVLGVLFVAAIFKMKGPA